MINLDKTTNTNRANPGREQERARLAFESAFRDGISQGDLSPYLSSIAFSLSFYLSFDRIWCRRNFRETRCDGGGASYVDAIKRASKEEAGEVWWGPGLTSFNDVKQNRAESSQEPRSSSSTDEKHLLNFY